MRCNNEDLVMYTYDELEPERRRELERHLETCAACAREAEALRATAAAVRDGSPLPAPPPELEERILRRAAALIIRPEPLWRRLPHLPRTSPLRTALMSAAAAAMLVTAFWMRHPGGTASPDTAADWHEAFYAELVLLTAEADSGSTGDAVLDQLGSDMDQLSLALAAY